MQATTSCARSTKKRLCVDSLSKKRSEEEEAELSAPFYIAASRIHGTGLFASRLIPRGAWLGDYIGNLLTLEEAERVPDDQSRFHMLNDVLGMVVDGDILANDMRWINHSARPNSYVLPTIDGRLRVHAKRNISAHQEITIDYGPSHWTEEEKAGNIKEDDGCCNPVSKISKYRKIH